MPIYKWVREEVEKYSYITDSEMKNGVVYFYYLKNGKRKHKRLPFRANKKQLMALLDRIKKDIKYDEYKAALDVKVRKALAEDKAKEEEIIFKIV